jgi:hypothetical protein
MNATSRRTLSVAFAAAAVLAATACSAVGDVVNGPPESEYTQAEAYAPMEAVAAESVGSLSDFPGFEQRLWAEMPCSHNGIDDPDYTNIEIRYKFSLEVSETDQVREDYVDRLREHWTAQGYEIVRDEESTYGDRLDRNLVVRTEDGITLWYGVAGYVALMIQSGCVPVSDPSEIEYVPPTGGIEPGGEGDDVSRYFPDGIPTDQAAAVDPFADTQAAAGPEPFDSPGSYENLL